MVNYMVEERRKLKLRLKDFVATHPDMPRDKVLGLMSYETGFRISTLETLLQELIAAGMIEVKKDA